MSTKIKKNNERGMIKMAVIRRRKPPTSKDIEVKKKENRRVEYVSRKK